MVSIPYWRTPEGIKRAERQDWWITHTIRPVLVALAFLTYPIWILPFLWYMSPSKAQKKEYAEYEAMMDEWEQTGVRPE